MRFVIEAVPPQYSLERQRLVSEPVLQREKPTNVSGAAYIDATVHYVIDDIGNISSYDLRSQPGDVHGDAFTISDGNACASRADNIARNASRPGVAKQNDWHRKPL